METKLSMVKYRRSEYGVRRTVLPLSVSLNIGYRYFARHLAERHSVGEVRRGAIEEHARFTGVGVSHAHDTDLSVGRSQAGTPITSAWQMEPLVDGIVGELDRAGGRRAVL